MFQPKCEEIRDAARPRPASVPSGKSHSGCSPETGSYTQCTLDVPSTASHRNVALLAERMRPRIVSSPLARTSRSSFLGVIAGPEQRAGPVAVGARAGVTLGV